MISTQDYFFNCQVEEYLKRTYCIEELGIIIESILNDNIDMQHFGIIGLSKIFRRYAPINCIKRINDSNIVPRIFEFILKEEFPINPPIKWLIWT